MLAKSLSAKTIASEPGAPKWRPLLRRPAMRAAVVLIGIVLFPSAMTPAPQAALAQTGASAFRAFASSPAAALDFRGDSRDVLAHALGAEFQAASLRQWATPVGWTLRGAKRVPGLRGKAILLLLDSAENRPLGVLIEPLDAPASSAIRIQPLGGMTIAAFTRRGFGFAVAGPSDGGVEAWLSAAGFADEDWSGANPL